MVDIKNVSAPSFLGNTRRATGRGSAASSKKGAFKAIAEEGNILPLSNSQPLSNIDIMGLLDVTIHPGEQKKTIIDYGEDLLQKLEFFRSQIISGGVSVDLLKDIRQRLGEGVFSHMAPELYSIIQDIRIRAEVELAKLGY